MTSSATSVQEYMDQLPEDRKEPMSALRKAIKKNLPKGFKEQMSYGMIGYVVPHSLYPAGYHVTPELPLPYLNIASQKNFIAVYYIGLYADEKILEWFKAAYSKQVKTKLAMGKGCIRFTKMDQIPYPLIGELAAKMTPQQWIELYKKGLKK